MYFSFLYLDPGSGSYLIQAIVAGILGFLFFFKNIWYSIKAFFFRKPKEAKKEEENADHQ